MRYRRLGRTGLTVSEIGYGCASWWGKPRFPEADALGLVHAAIDLGVTFFDTGASYSAGEAEPRLGRALAGRDVSRLVIATKAGTFHAGGGRIARDFSPTAITASVERSLGNLGLEQVQLLQLHGPAIGELTDELRSALADLKQRGLVRAFGVNSFDTAVIEHVVGLPDFDVVMVDYNVLRPEREPLIHRAAAAGKGVLAGMALAMGHTGLKVAKLKGPQDLWYAARGLVRHRDEVLKGARFGFLHRQPGVTGSQAALAYVLENPHVACAVIGTTRLAHLQENAVASGMELPPQVRAGILGAQRR
ncbi:aldo/keto reductase [Phenylobacterium sp. J367]|uniref:aldo/keto reductase n=1 Tax=Phenylobacterium sp. J367 TaxID=2898435 RepID=UPI002150EF63|nr:aldo/keto reductase [Phenylobacterium sp. J367]MCR5880504.1 aldo/keto reductase [Phenylobacterium sp. J367]